MRRVPLAHKIPKHSLPLSQASFSSVVSFLFFSLLVSLLVVPVLAADEGSLAMRVGRVLERELGGEVMEALADYRLLLPDVPAADRVLAEKILYRIGLCEQRLGRPEESRRSWRKLLESYPANDPQVVRAREALKRLEQELDRIMIEGRVIQGFRSSASFAKATEATGVQGSDSSFILHPSTFLLAGEWGNEPGVLSRSNGEFRVARKVAGRLKEGRRYGLVFAEHPTLPRVGVGIGGEEGSGVIDIELKPAISLTGRVVDSRGNPVEGALIRVMGYGGDDIPLPFNAILPPIITGTNGGFIIKGVVPGLRYVLTADKEGCRLVKSASVAPGIPAGSTPIDVGSIVIQSLGEVSLCGRVVDDVGLPVLATVGVWTLPPVEREIGRVSTTPDGRFEVRDLRENLVALQVESEGYASRSVSGLKPMGQEVDVVVKRGGGQGLRGSGGGVQSPESKVQSPGGRDLKSEITDHPSSFILHNFPSLLWLRGNPETGEALQPEGLKGRVVVYHFGSAYVEGTLRSLYPGEPGMLSSILKLYGDQGLVIIWVLPEEEGKGEAARMALEMYPDLSVAVGGNPPARGNLVVNRDGTLSPLCSDQALFKAVKQALGY